MGQVLIRNLDDALIADYRSAAKLAGRSLEAELRDALMRGRPDRGRSRRALLDQVCGLIPPLAGGATGGDVIREYRESHGGRWADDAPAD